jgi:short subunit dehydrogenase
LQVLELDVTDEDSVRNGVMGALRQAGHLDVVINNAGVAGTASPRPTQSNSFSRCSTSTWLMGRCGYTIDNLLSAEVVLPDASVVTASEASHRPEAYPSSAATSTAATRTDLSIGTGLVADERAHLRIIEHRQHPFLDAELRQLDALGEPPSQLDNTAVSTKASLPSRQRPSVDLEQATLPVDRLSGGQGPRSRRCRGLSC